MRLFTSKNEYSTVYLKAGKPHCVFMCFVCVGETSTPSKFSQFAGGRKSSPASSSLNSVFGMRNGSVFVQKGCDVLQKIIFKMKGFLTTAVVLNAAIV